MPDRSGGLVAHSRMQVASVTAAMVALMIVAGAARCQTAPSPTASGVQAPAQPAAAPTGEPAPPAAPPHEENPGLINEIGKMFGKLPALKSPTETIDDLNTRAKDAAKDANETLSRLATPLMVTGRTACAASANGAPDCKTASDKLCQTKGFKEGKSLTTDSAEICSAKVRFQAGLESRMTAGPTPMSPARCVSSAAAVSQDRHCRVGTLRCWHDVWQSSDPAVPPSIHDR